MQRRPLPSPRGGIWVPHRGIWLPHTQTGRRPQRHATPFAEIDWEYALEQLQDQMQADDAPENATAEETAAQDQEFDATAEESQEKVAVEAAADAAEEEKVAAEKPTSLALLCRPFYTSTPTNTNALRLAKKTSMRPSDLLASIASLSQWQEKDSKRSRSRSAKPRQPREEEAEPRCETSVLPIGARAHRGHRSGSPFARTVVTAPKVGRT